MSLFGQLLWGTAVLSICAIIHVSMVAGSIPILIKAANTADDRFPKLKVAFLVGLAFAMIVAAHTVQIWVWAFSFVAMSALPDIETAAYFSLVTYTTLGYGDLVLGENLRIFSAFAAVTGLLTFGVSTAFLVGLVARVLPKSLD